jgi:hypothetical protein
MALGEGADPEYLGDGVYVTHDGWHLELRLNAHTDPVVVYLEPIVMDRLLLYYRKFFNKKVEAHDLAEYEKEKQT